MEKSKLQKILKNVVMKNVGYKDSNKELPSVSTISNINYPSLYLSNKNLPDLKGYDVEDEILFLVKGKITSHSLNEYGKDIKENWDIQVNKISIINK